MDEKVKKTLHQIISKLNQADITDDEKLNILNNCYDFVLLDILKQMKVPLINKLNIASKLHDDARNYLIKVLLETSNEKE